jgi:hypothetical protein
MLFYICRYLLHPRSRLSLCITFELYSIIYVIAPLFHFQFSQFYYCAHGNMATFHVASYSDFTIMVNESRMTSIFEHCLCAIFIFQLGSLHISKDILYDSYNLVSSSLY